MRLFGLATLTGLIVASVSCETYEAPPDDDYVFHENFEFGVAHETIGCDGCHILAAVNMLSDTWVPDIPGSNWQTDLQLNPINSCLSCHPFIREPGTPEEEVQCETLAPGNAYLESERCRYILFPSHNPQSPQLCTQCHSIDQEGWGTSGEGGGSPHDDAPLLDIFPLIAGHADRGCEECHDGDPQLESGQAQSCLNCHSRAEDPSQGLAHYPPARPGAGDEERDCYSCHVNYTLGGDMVWPTSWLTDRDDGTGTPLPPVNHSFLVAHNTVDTWLNVAPEDTVPNAPADYKTACWNCHNGWPNDANPPTQIYMDFNETVTYGNCTSSCHAQEVADSHGSGNATCTGSGCHPTAGPTDFPFP